MSRLDNTNTVPADEDVVQTYARLHAECKAVGHGLHDKVHRGDLWIAATTISIGGTLLTLDKIFRGAPRLKLFPSDQT